MKTAEYLGKEYEVPDWTNFVAGDSDGQVWAYEKMPHWKDHITVGGYYDAAGRYEYVGEFNLPVVDVG